MPENRPGHKTRYSDSSLYDEKCVYCGATASIEDHRLYDPCPGAPKEEAAVIFVFGSNLAGRHGKGAALHARQHHGAIYGQGRGHQGNSYAIATKDEKLRTLPLDVIARDVKAFILYASMNPALVFQVTAIGTGLAGYSHEQIAPMFKDAPSNCHLPAEWVGLVR